jgi:hypothetical protein
MRDDGSLALRMLHVIMDTTIASPVSETRPGRI